MLTLGTRPQQGASIVQPSPFLHLDKASRSLSPPDVGAWCYETIPFHQARSNRRSSRIAKVKHAQTTPTTRCKHRRHKLIREHQLDIPLSPPARRRGVALPPSLSIKQEAIAGRLVSSRTSTLGRRPQQGASIVVASPPEYINSTSRSHSRPDVEAWCSGQALPTSKKQLQIVSYRQGQARSDDAHNKVQASSSQAHPSTSTRHPLSLPARRKDVAFRPRQRPSTCAHDGRNVRRTLPWPHRGTPTPRPSGRSPPYIVHFEHFLVCQACIWKSPKRHLIEKSLILLLLCPGHDCIMFRTFK